MSNIKLFEDKKVRSLWNEGEEEWYFSVVDVIQVLTDSSDPKDYWYRMKKREKLSGFELSTICRQLKIEATDGKKYATDCASTEGLLRIIQSIPSPKAEPFKLWLAKVGSERLDEIADPEKGIDRLMETYLKKGYSKEWVNQRLKSIEVRKDLTDEWENRGVKKGQEYAILTDEITKAWSGLSVKEYKNLKDLKKENLRDNMSNLELVLNMLAEATTTEISKEKKPKTFSQSKTIANQGGTIAGNTRKEIEAKTGKKIVSPVSAKKLLNSKNQEK
jgi:hypothetical protein